jgi:hypothetical protein
MTTLLETSGLQKSFGAVVAPAAGGEAAPE